MITAAQCRAARAWLDLTQTELAQMIGRGQAAVGRFESSQGAPLRLRGGGDSVIALALQHVLEVRGIVFHSGGIDGPRE